MQVEFRDKTSLAVLADLVGGDVSGDPSTVITGVGPLESAGTDQIAFLAHPKFKAGLDGCRAAALIVSPALKGELTGNLLLVENPYLAFAKILTFFAVPAHNGQGILPGAHIHPQAVIGKDVTVSPGCVVAAGAKIGERSFLHPNVVLGAESTVGKDCILHANVTVREKCMIGNRVIIQPCAVIGADGFGFAPDGQSYYKIPQIGHVVIEDDVEIGACSCIDRGTMGVTLIGRGTKIDNLVQVGHNVQIGEDNIVVSQVGIAGSTVIGNHCIMGGQAGVAGHIKIGDNVTLAARGGISNNVADNQTLAGAPAMPHREWLKTTVAMPHLPEMRRELIRLRQQLDDLKNKLSEGEH